MTIRTVPLILVFTLFACATEEPIDPGVDAGPVADAATAPRLAGSWDIEWYCVGGCEREPSPSLVATEALEVSAHELRWHGGGLDISHAVNARRGDCLIVPPDDTRAEYALCPTPGGATVFVASWLNPATNWRQSYEARAIRPGA